MSDDYNDRHDKIAHSKAAVTLADEFTHFESLARPSSETDIWEETAAGVVAGAGDYDVLLRVVGYALFGNGQGIWGPGQPAEREVQLITVPKKQRGTMSDNKFVRVGWTPTERLRGDEFTVTATDDEVTWDLDGLKFVAAPPTWEIQGRAGDVNLDLVYEQIRTAVWNWGPFEEAAKGDRAEYDTFVNVNGSIRTSQLELVDGVRRA